jgi:hypothetical protein
MNEVEFLMNRRTVLRLLSTAGIAPASAAFGSLSNPRNTQVQDLLFRPQDFGANVDGRTLDFPAINATIDRAHSRRRNDLPQSRYPSLRHGGSEEQRNVIYRGRRSNPRQYRRQAIPPQPGPKDTADANTRHLIFAKNAEDVTLCGPGMVDGQGPSFWAPSGRRKYAPEEQWGDTWHRFT